MKVVGVSMKIRIKYQELPNESGEGKYEIRMKYQSSLVWFFTSK